MKKVPHRRMQPALYDAGLEGSLDTGKLLPHRLLRLPVQPLRRSSARHAGDVPHAARGKAEDAHQDCAFDITACLPYAHGRNCMVMRRAPPPCPTKPSTFSPWNTSIATAIRTQQPHVNPNRCIGCGICESVSPFRDRPAIHSVAANESRHPDNQPILPIKRRSVRPIAGTKGAS
ncbi:MAG: 4Fe-4S binding protein [Phycisphaerales bacterium]|nr:4Fe-4S binding protein [Phycisphaerales bacterium]